MRSPPPIGFGNRNYVQLQVFIYIVVDGFGLILEEGGILMWEKGK